MRRPLMRGHCGRAAFFLLLNQQAAQRPQLVKLALLRIDQLVQLLNGIFQAYYLEFDIDQTIFHIVFTHSWQNGGTLV